MIQDRIWTSFGDTEAFAEIADARLVVLKNIWPPPHYGWRWVVIPRTLAGRLDIDNAIQSTDANSEQEPYPSEEAAQYAAENYYARNWHGVDAA